VLHGRPANYFRIAELSYGTPARVDLEPHATGREPCTGHIIIERLERVREAFANGTDLDEIDADLLADIGRLAKPVGTLVKSAALRFNGAELELTQTVAQRVERALQVADECEGSFEGMLERINIHLGADIFYIYLAVGPRHIACKFPSRLYDDAVSAVGRHVEVRGTLRYRARATFPHEIAVAEIDIYQPDSELPNWEDLRGRAPDATDGLPSEKFVRELRDDWR
jgi:hypothetical protein